MTLEQVGWFVPAGDPEIMAPDLVEMDLYERSELPSNAEPVYRFLMGSDLATVVWKQALVIEGMRAALDGLTAAVEAEVENLPAWVALRLTPHMERAWAVLTPSEEVED